GVTGVEDCGEYLGHQVAGQRRNRLEKGTAKGIGARAAQYALERVVPQDDAAFSIEDRHPLIERFNRLARAMLVRTAAHEFAVSQIRQNSRNSAKADQPPRAMVDGSCENSGTAATYDVGR